MELPPDAELETLLNEKLAPTLDLLERMVAMNSFSTNKQGVNALGRFTAVAFHELGFEAEFVPSVHAEYGDHLILRRGPLAGPVLGLISHLDTVYSEEEEQRNRFFWRPEQDRIHGPGTVDIKGGTVLIHLVLQAIRDIAPETFQSTRWMVLLNSSEEVLSSDFGDLCLQRLGSDARAALVFEAGAVDGNLFSLVPARKGRATFEVTVEGRSAHAGSHHARGANAIVQLARTIERIAGLTDYSRHLTFNVGTASGGTVINRVPHLASAELEMRAFTPEIYRAGMQAILALNGFGEIRSAVDDHPCLVRVELKSETPPWPRNEATDRLLALFQEAAGSMGGRVVRDERGGISDGNYLWQTIPTLDGLGPAGDHAHCSEQTPDGVKQQEYVDVRSFVPKAALNIGAILRLLEAGKA
jgi:glutamate carboxypeptidase